MSRSAETLVISIRSFICLLISGFPKIPVWQLQRRLGDRHKLPISPQPDLDETGARRIADSMQEMRRQTTHRHGRTGPMPRCSIPAGCSPNVRTCALARSCQFIATNAPVGGRIWYVAIMAPSHLAVQETVNPGSPPYFCPGWNGTGR
jgi:hypothetical protein